LLLLIVIGFCSITEKVSNDQKSEFHRQQTSLLIVDSNDQCSRVVSSPKFDKCFGPNLSSKYRVYDKPSFLVSNS